MARHSSVFTASSRNLVGFEQQVVWVSIRPGSTVRLERSIRRAPAGGS
jgi:hypothetical protein